MHTLNIVMYITYIINNYYTYIIMIIMEYVG